MVWNRTPRFRGFRDQSRDAQTDLQRSEAVLQSITDAITSLDAEAAGLKRRIDELRAWVGGLVGPENMSNETRDSRIESELVAAERQLMNGLKRLSDLTAIRSSYCDLKGAIAAERARALRMHSLNG